MQKFRARTNIPVLIVLLLFGIIYCAISLVNHYLFRTNALDLGMFNHAIYYFSRFENAIFSLSVNGEENNYFADHFSPLTVLLAPFRYLFGTYTLLVLQIAAILFGGYGIFKLALRSGLKHWLALVVLIQFFSIWAIYSALAFDFHTNVLAAMFVPWLVYFYRTDNRPWFLVFFMLILFSKENMALWLVFIMLGLMIRKNADLKKYLRFELPLVFLAFLYTVVVVVWAMPELSSTGDNVQMNRYAYLGDGLTTKLQTILSSPLETFDLLFYQTRFPDAPLGIKAEFHITMLLSGGFLLLFRPKYLVMLIPIYAQKFLSSTMEQWSIMEHYSIEFVPIISLAVVDCTKWFNNDRYKGVLLILVSISTIVVSVNKLNSNNKPWYDNTNVDLFSAKHYHAGLDHNEVLEAIALLPSSAPISVSSHLAPHLAFREKIYFFPNINDAEYVALIYKDRDLYPMNKRSLHALVDSLIEKGNFELIHFEPNTMVLRRKGIIPDPHDLLPPPKLTWNARVEEYRQIILKDSVWLENVRQKSIVNSISLDEMIQNDAVFLTEQELKKDQP